MYTQTTNHIRITVRPEYLAAQSSPQERHWFWAYHVRIENQGAETVRLTHRHWRITDATGRVQEVVGVGVVGEQPVLEPGEAFEYTSGCPLSTPSGFMAGSYRMERAGGGAFEAQIPAFSLDSPANAPTRLN
ncbi:MAG TPA: Co2+/Mg2+ efflux protein ApaG [Azospirillaceae bacterium]|nr:Co2+/Mg2+ efflux protein ApaG [Azospirillaceae bacterium]